MEINNIARVEGKYLAKNENLSGEKPSCFKHSSLVYKLVNQKHYRLQLFYVSLKAVCYIFTNVEMWLKLKHLNDLY